jgi:ribosomal protein S12 methylthiotransferase
VRDFEPVGIVSLGCPKNIVDSERLLGNLLKNEVSITFDINEARSVIINTCAFLQSAREEAESVIKEFVEKKRKGLIRKIVVSGCYPSLSGKSLLYRFPEIDAITGTNDLHSIVNALSGEEKIILSKDFEMLVPPRLQITLLHYEYLKIADGCNHRCAFCLIPKIKGDVHSFPIEFLVNEAQSLAENEVKELILIAQDTTQYGIDIYGKNSLLLLLEKLEKVSGIEWIRILYTYPSEISKPLVEYIASKDNKVVPYIDVPIQHISDRILKRMNRIGGSKLVRDLVYLLKSHGIAVRTTVITGFPGETEKDFKELLDFVEEVKFEHLGAFAFSREPGTESFDMDGQLDEKVKQNRLRQIEELQHKINMEKFKSMAGKKIPVIADYFDETLNAFIGRTIFDAPEIDDFVVLRGDIEEGKIANAVITGFNENNLFGEVKK